MQPETKTCQNCKVEFVIASEDFAFYEKLQVPPPTWCPQCRTVRRMLWRNERMLYRNTCGLCKRSIISIYSPQTPYVVYCNECFHGDGWDPMSYGVDVDFSRPFLEQFKELQLKVPRLYSFVVQNANSEYANGAAYNKNCYLIFVSDHNEDSSYSYGIMHSKNVMDCLSTLDSELCYEAVNCTKCYHVTFSEDCSDCSNVAFSKNCANCQDCVGCVNLRNKRYHIFNEPYSKEEYAEKIKTLALDTREGIAALQEKLAAMATSHPVKYLHGSRNVSTTGDYIYDSKASTECYDAEALEDCKNIVFGFHTKNTQDAYVIVENSQFSYEAVSAITVNNVKASFCVWTDFDVAYSDTCENCNNLFGCIDLKKKQYCILNKQYSKEEYEALLARIIQHMKDMPYKNERGVVYGYGEFFPLELSPFAYNETVAQEYFPLTKDDATKRGFSWREPEARNYNITLRANQVPNTASEIQDSILSEVIGCEHEGKCVHGCSEAFKITESELQFYRRMNLPLPALCSNCRHMRRHAMKNPLALWKRQCACAGDVSANKAYVNTAKHFHGAAACSNEFETSYTPNRPEIVYCEQCYNAELA